MRLSTPTTPCATGTEARTSLQGVDDQETFYEANRARFTGLLRVGSTQTRGWQAVAALAVVGLIGGWVYSVQRLSAVQAQKTRGYVVVLGPDGKRVEAPVQDVAEFRLSERMVAERLIDVVTCLQGLDADIAVTRACWRREHRVFAGDEAVAMYQRWAQQTMSKEALYKRQQEGPIRVLSMSWQRDRDAQGRYRLFWTTEQRGKRLKWSGWFEVQLQEVGVNPDEPGLQVVRWDWKIDAQPREGGA